MRLIGAGRHADVFELSSTRVLRRYRTGQDATPEALVMAHVRAHGFPAPEVYRAAGAEMELERVDGPSLLEVIARSPHRLPHFARLLADLHQQLHEIVAPTEVPRPFGQGEQGGQGDRVLHLDLQPGNVVLSDRGPVLLDWGWAAAGAPEIDVAHTWLELATSAVPGAAPVRIAASLGRGVFVRSFLRHFDAMSLRAVLPEVAAYRLRERELTPEERCAVGAFSDRVTRTSR
jgi:tRNA A-37 threonylcarbamoyl transferase component Bud32